MREGGRKEEGGRVEAKKGTWVGRRGGKKEGGKGREKPKRTMG